MNTGETGPCTAGPAAQPADNRQVAISLTVALLSRLPLPPCPDEAVDLALCLYRRFAGALDSGPNEATTVRAAPAAAQP